VGWAGGSDDWGTVGITGTGVLTAGWRATTAVSVASGELTELDEKNFVPTTTKKSTHEKSKRSRANM
jgi:hypothetical protein